MPSAEKSGIMQKRAQKGVFALKFLHISDLHLGRKFYGLTFLPQQEKMLTQIVQLVQE